MKSVLESGEYLKLASIIDELMDDATVEEDGDIVFTDRSSDVVDKILEHLEIEG